MWMEACDIVADQMFCGLWVIGELVRGVVSAAVLTSEAACKVKY